MDSLSNGWKNTGAIVQNLLTKGSLNHLTHQKKTPEQHFTEIAQTITLAQNNIETNVYLEDWSMECVIPLNMCLNI
jgi:D-citramalate synthase